MIKPYKMNSPILEPLPPVKPPPETEPEVRVGVVLKRDQKGDITLTSQSALEVNGVSLSVRELKISAANNTLRINGSSSINSKQALIRSSSPITIHKVNAGRGFHWENERSMSYPGSIEISSEENLLQAVCILPYEEYVESVVGSEMNPDTPQNFRDAQMIAARSWAWVFMGTKHPGEHFDVCNDDCCQRFQGVTFLGDKKRNSSKGLFLLHDKEVVPAYYAKTCGGVTDLPLPVLKVDLPYFSSVFDGEDSAPLPNLSSEEEFLKFLNHDNSHCFCGSKNQKVTEALGGVDIKDTLFRWQKRLNKEEIVSNIRKVKGILCTEVVSITPLERSVSGRVIKLELKLRLETNEEISLLLDSQLEIRETLDPSFLYSSAFSVKEDKDSYIFTGAGWGHGVGLCQVGAVEMSLRGYSCEKILSHYFPGTTLHKAY